MTPQVQPITNPAITATISIDAANMATRCTMLEDVKRISVTTTSVGGRAGLLLSVAIQAS